VGNKVYQVFTETVGQYTGLFDKNGQKIFEGDILMEKHNDLGVATFRNGYFGFERKRYFTLLLQHAKDCEVIGNIHKSNKFSSNIIETEDWGEGMIPDHDGKF